MKKSIQIAPSLIFVSTFLVALGISAVAQIHSAEAMVVRAGETFSLDEYATLDDDLYVVAEMVELSGTTTGDVLALGSYVEQSGTTTEDVLILGGNVVQKGSVMGDIRIVGGKVLINGYVHEDVVVAGGTVLIGENAVIDGDLFVAADHLVIEGSVAGHVQMKARLVEIEGKVGKDVRASVRESLSLTKDAHVTGGLTYRALREAFISETVQVEGSVDFTQTDSVAEKNTINLVGLLMRIILAAVSGIVLALLFPRYMREMTDHALSAGSGVRMLKAGVLLLGVPIISILLLFTLVGLLPGVALLFLYALVILIAMAFTPILSGVFLARWMKKENDELKPLWVALGAVAITFVAYLPVLGWIVRLLFFLLGFYTVYSLLVLRIWNNRKSTVVSKATVHKKNETSATEKQDEEHSKKEGE